MAWVVFSLLYLLVILGSLLICAAFLQFPISLLLAALAFGLRSRTIYACYQALTSTVASIWLTCVALVFELGYGLQYHITCDERTTAALRSDEQGQLFICNHRTRLDWAMLWPVLARAGALRKLKIITKDALRWTPFFLGPAIQVARFLFLSRKWAQDEGRASALYELLRKGPAQTEGWGAQRESATPPPAYALLLFPEGTDLHPAALEKSHSYAETHGRQRLQCVLQPRVKGLAHALLSLAQGLGEAPDRPTGSSSAVGERPVEAMVDITLAYEGGIPQNEAVLTGWRVSTPGVRGEGDTASVVRRMPAAVHVHMQAIPMPDILRLFPARGSLDPSPLDLQAVERIVEPWLYQRWLVKEVALRAFYATPPMYKPVLDVAGAQQALHECNNDAGAAASLLIRRHSPNTVQFPSPVPIRAYATVVLIVAVAAYLLQSVCRRYPWLLLCYVAALTVWLYFLGPSTWGGCGLGAPMDVVELQQTRGKRRGLQ